MLFLACFLSMFISCNWFRISSSISSKTFKLNVFFCILKRTRILSHLWFLGERFLLHLLNCYSLGWIGNQNPSEKISCFCSNIGRNLELTFQDLVIEGIQIFIIERQVTYVTK